MKLRIAQPADVPALAALAKSTFVQTFVTELAIPYPEPDLRAHLEHAYSEAATARLLGAPSLRLCVAEDEGALIGYALTGPCQLPHPEARGEHGELRRLYIDHRFQGQGAGRALFDDALLWLEAHFVGPLWLGVWSGNLRAQRFYQRNGFSRVGEYDYPVGSWLDHEFIFRRERE